MSDATHRLDDAGRAALREVAPEIVMEFRGEHNRKLSTRKEMRWGAKGSFSLAIAGSREGLWFDHEIGRGGDIIEFIKIERGCSFVDALDHAAQYVSELRNGHHSSRPASRPAPRQTVDDDGDDEKRIDTGAHDLVRSPAADRDARRAVSALTLHRGANRGARGSEISSALSLGDRNAPGNGGAGPRHHHRRADRHPPHGIVGRRQQDRPKALGLKGGGAIKLSPLMGAGGELLIGEGIETTLSASILGFGSPAWSVIDAGEMSRFPALPWISRLTIAVDHDVKGAGEKAAAETKARWEAAGLRVRTAMPSTPGEDFNDVLKVGAGAGRNPTSTTLRERERQSG